MGRYGVALDDLERLAIPALQADADVVVVDELGKMELTSAPFRDAVIALLDGPVAVVATGHARRHPFTDEFKRRPSVAGKQPRSPTVEGVLWALRRHDSPPEPAAAGAEAGGSPAGRQSLPWHGRGDRADWVIVAAIAASGLLPLALLPLVPALLTSHPALLELLRGSTTAIINVGARARVGETSLASAVLLAVPSLMMFDWAFWWAGRRWGDRVFVWLLGGSSPRTERRLARLHRIESRVGPFAVVLAYLLPIPSALIYAAVGDGGMRLGVFLALDVLGTLLWSGLLAGAGYGFGQQALDVANAVSHYGLWVTAALILIVAVRVRRRTR